MITIYYSYIVSLKWFAWKIKAIVSNQFLDMHLKWKFGKQPHYLSTNNINTVINYYGYRTKMTHPVLAKFPKYRIMASDNVASAFVKFREKWFIPSVTIGAPNIYGSSSPWAVPILCKSKCNKLSTILFKCLDSTKS